MNRQVAATNASALFLALSLVLVNLANAMADDMNLNTSTALAHRHHLILPDPILFFTRQWLHRHAIDASFPSEPLSASEWTQLKALPDVLVATCAFGFWIRICTLDSVPIALRCLRRSLWVLGFMYCARAMSVVMTVLPSPTPGCKSTKHPTDGIFADLIRLITFQRYIHPQSTHVQ
jgi:hypothetical protein